TRTRFQFQYSGGRTRIGQSVQACSFLEERVLGPSYLPMDFTDLEKLKVACICPFCLDFFKDPMTLSCGHNFCFVCISLSWKNLNDNFTCPECQMNFPQRNYRRNHQIRNLTAIVKDLQKKPRENTRQDKQPECQKHQQALGFFCELDRKLLCVQCSFSAEHQMHNIQPIKKAAFHFKTDLFTRAKHWVCKLKGAEKVLTQQRRRVLELRKEFGSKKKEISFEFEQVKLLLQNQYGALLSELLLEELVGLSKMNECLGTLSDQISTLKNLMREAEAKGEQSDVTLLTSFPRTYHRFENMARPELWSFRTKQRVLCLPLQYSGLDRIIKQFQIDVTFDIDTAHPQLLISEDGKSVLFNEARQSVNASPRRFHHWPALLGCQGFHLGRCYWEIQVGNKPMWTLGVCQDCFPGDLSNQPSVAEGFWAIGRSSKSGYVTYGPKTMELLPLVQPSRIGIFLDYELGELSFYNMNDRSLLYTFTNYFTSTIWPYFCTGTDPEPLKILPRPH
ncbi:tripartite motif-containing protein 60, partial [Sigmodon hispidus]